MADDEKTLGQVLLNEMIRVRHVLSDYKMRAPEGIVVQTLRQELNIASNALEDGSVDDIIGCYLRLRLYQ
jgi:hypothetical protein